MRTRPFTSTMANVRASGPRRTGRSAAPFQPKRAERRRARLSLSKRMPLLRFSATKIPVRSEASHRIPRLRFEHVHAPATHAEPADREARLQCDCHVRRAPRRRYFPAGNDLIEFSDGLGCGKGCDELAGFLESRNLPRQREWSARSKAPRRVRSRQPHASSMPLHPVPARSKPCAVAVAFIH